MHYDEPTNAKERAMQNVVKQMMKSPMLEQAKELFCPHGYTQVNNKIIAQKREGFNIYEPRGWQVAPIRDIVVGKNVIIQAKVGSGKGTVIENSISNSGLLGYICAPTIALCLDMKKRLEQRGAKVCVWSSVTPLREKKAFKDNPRDYHAVIFAPESIDTIPIVTKQNFYIDESHNIVMSASYREAFSRLGEFWHRLLPTSTSLLSATLDDHMIDAFKEMFFKCSFVEYRDKNPDRENILYRTPQKIGYDNQEILRLLRENAEKGRSAIIYTFKTASVDAMAVNMGRALSSMGYEVIPFHSKVKEKEQKMNDFASKQSCVIATSAFGEGIDKKDIGLIIRYGFPFSITQLVQEAGRIERGRERDGTYVLYRLGTEQSMFGMNKLKNVQKVLNKMSNQFETFKYDDFLNETTVITFLLKHHIIKQNSNTVPYYTIEFTGKDYKRSKSKKLLTQLRTKKNWYKQDLEEMDEEYIKLLKNAKQSGYIAYTSPTTTHTYKKLRAELNATDMHKISEFNKEVERDFKELTSFFEANDKKEWLKEYYECTQ